MTRRNLHSSNATHKDRGYDIWSASYPPSKPKPPVYRDARHKRQAVAKLARQAAAAKRGR